jgi:glutathione synthase/RimK-type ligase-like ATP-grasp enzyme
VNYLFTRSASAEAATSLFILRLDPKTCLFATCEALPGSDPDDRLAADALAPLGVGVRPAVWTDPNVDWSAADACVLRSTWDYHRQADRFSAWIDTVARSTQLINPAHVVAWNAHKFYLRDLAQCGVPIVPSEWLLRGVRVDLAALLRERGWNDAILKPAYGASAHGVLRVGPSGVTGVDAQHYVETLLREQDAIVQPYLETVDRYHERALVFFGGRYSHAVTKSPFMHAGAPLEERAHVPPGTSGEEPVEATGEEVAVASQALDAAPSGHAYARVDVVRDDDWRVRVLEVELIEPTLYLYAHPQAPSRFALAIAEAMTNKTIRERSFP